MFQLLEVFYEKNLYNYGWNLYKEFDILYKFHLFNLGLIYKFASLIYSKLHHFLVFKITTVFSEMLIWIITPVW